MNFVRNYLLAVQFFTRIPVTGRLAAWVGFSPQMLRASAAHFPGVGWLVGALVTLLHVLLFKVLPEGGYSPLVLAGLGTAFGILLTGAFHEDGWADVADGLGGSYQRGLDIMKDCRVGAFGAIAIAMVLLTKVALVAELASLDMLTLAAVLFLGHVVAHTWPLLTIRLLPHVGDTASSKSKPPVDQLSMAALVVALLWCVLAFVLVAWLLGGGIVLTAGMTGAVGCSGLAFAWMHRMFSRRLQGFTGDCLGATQQICELAFYLSYLLAAGMHL